MEELVSITPVNFFQISFPCRHLALEGSFPRLTAKNHKAYLLPDTSSLCDEVKFATAAMGWNKEGLEFYFKVDKAFENARFPDVFQGDSIEVFIDTRDVKTSGFNTRFCHRFFFLPELVDGRQAGELTHFRTEDRHELCNPSDLFVKADVRKKEYEIFAHIPKNCLVGYDSEQFNRMGFSYRINRPYWESQHFSVTTRDYHPEQQPSLWSHARLVK